LLSPAEPRATEGLVLYKVTPTLASPEKKPAKNENDANAPKEPRKRRKSAVFDGDGNEVLITMMCLKCRTMKPLTMFGLRKMADGAIRNQPWCRTCRSGASAKKKPEATEVDVATVAAPTVETPAVERREDAAAAADEISAPS
jgi:hypothetical protein